MKYIFGTNITKDKKNSVMDGQIFHNHTSEPILEDAFDKCDQITQNLAKQTSLPIWLEIIKWLSMSIGCLLLASIIGASVPIREVYGNAPIFFYVAAVSFILFFILYIVERSKKKYHETDEYVNEKHYIQSVAAYAKDVIQIPEDARIIEVLAFYYKIRNGKMKVIERTNSVDTGFVSYQNCPLYAYIRSGNLHLANLFDEWVIPLYCFTGIKRIYKKISVPSWKKEIQYNKGKYKKYKMIGNNLGYIYFRPYYAFGVTFQGDDYELLIPPYELEELSSLVSLHITVS